MCEVSLDMQRSGEMSQTHSCEGFVNKMDEVGVDRNGSRSWKRRLRQYSTPFADWLNHTDRRRHSFETTANYIEQFILDNLTEEATCRDFAAALPLCLKHCDENIYKNMGVTLAYAHLHFLERYHRFWDVLLTLLHAGILPMRHKGVNVLDVGTGPAPSLYAIQDFYSTFLDFASEKSIQELNTPEPTLEFIEKNRYMVWFIHHFSECCCRNGPYHPMLGDFSSIDVVTKHKLDKERYIYQIAEEDDTTKELVRLWVHEYEPWWNENWHYNFVIFSNFLTQLHQITELTNEIGAVFRSLRPGGIVVVVGGTGKQYPDLYAGIEQMAAKMRIRRIRWVPESLPCQYHDYHADRIKESYRRIWSEISKKIDLTHCKSELSACGASEVCDSNMTMKGPQTFGLRVFRKGRI